MHPLRHTYILSWKSRFSTNQGSFEHGQQMSRGEDAVRALGPAAADCSDLLGQVPGQHAAAALLHSASQFAASLFSLEKREKTARRRRFFPAVRHGTCFALRLAAPKRPGRIDSIFPFSVR
jgi:hypothetical protein